MRTNMLNLVSVARSKGSAIASSWSAHRHNDGEQASHVAVYHYGTYMFRVYDDGSVVGVSRGWGSMTDKCGTRKILTNVNGKGYADIFGK